MKANHNDSQVFLFDFVVYIKEQIYNFWKQITTILIVFLLSHSLYQRTNIQFLKANHNFCFVVAEAVSVYIKEQIYNFWKQITTTAQPPQNTCRFISKNKYTIFESKSQQRPGCCLRMRVYIKEQIYNFWKQITTDSQVFLFDFVFISKNKYTIFESKSQRTRWVCLLLPVYIKEQIYNFWKQITTNSPTECATHMFISKNKYTIFESKSQHTYLHPKVFRCLYQRTNIQFLKANHNASSSRLMRVCVYIKEQIYNFWKQITTSSLRRTSSRLFISKNKYTIFESKSQLDVFLHQFRYCLYQRTNIQFLKANHNT